MFFNANDKSKGTCYVFLPCLSLTLHLPLALKLETTVFLPNVMKRPIDKAFSKEKRTYARTDMDALMRATSVRVTGFRAIRKSGRATILSQASI